MVLENLADLFRAQMADPGRPQRWNGKSSWPACIWPSRVNGWENA
jgi:hypothetical protein